MRTWILLLIFLIKIPFLFTSCKPEKEAEIPFPVTIEKGDSFFSNYGLVKKPLKFTIPVSPSKRKQIFLIENPHINRISLNFSKNDSNLALGDHLKFEERPINFRLFAIPIYPLDEADTLHLEVDKSEESLSLGIRIMEEEEFLDYQKQDDRLIGFIIGIYLVTILGGLILIQRVFSKKAIFFLLYLFLSLCWLVNDSGLFYQYFWPQKPLFHSLSRGLFSATSICFFALYVYQNKNDRINRTIKKIFIGIAIFIGFKLIFNFVLGLRIFPDFVKGYYLSVNSIILLILFGSLLVLLVKDFLKKGESFFELGSIFVYCLFVFSQALSELGFTLIRIPHLHQFDALLFLGLQLFFMMIHIKQEETREKLKSIQQFSEFQIKQERLLKNRIIEVEVFERKRIAQNIHDEVGGVLAAIKYLTLSLQEKLRSKNYPIDFIPILNLLDEGVKNQYSIIDDLISKFDQGESLEHSVKKKLDVIFSGTNVNSEVLFLAPETVFNNHQKTQVYRIITELITNTLKHAKVPTFVSIQVKDTNPIEITYSDNGKGSKASVNTKGRGLENIKFRIDQLQGRIIRLRITEGFLLKFTIPKINE